ncbi:class II aldolase/adducin family protein [Lapillicoccus sp.]|uniref:class II aldolase/adducin family protein n=1 Tax=Lapillicoccus sp. TaxID=1909287 RepID=UPI003983248E
MVLAAVDLLFTAAVLSHSGHANLSARIDEDTFLLTTSGTVRDLRADQLATVTLAGEVVDGELTVENAEIVDMHAVVYRARPEVGAIIHTHSPAATGFALAHRELPCRAEPLLRFGQGATCPGRALGASGIGCFGARSLRRPGHPAHEPSAVLLANHGLLAFGPDPVAAARLVVRGVRRGGAGSVRAPRGGRLPRRCARGCGGVHDRAGS